MMRVLFFGSAVIIVLILSGYALLRIPYIQHRIKTLATATLEKQFGVQLELGKITGNLLSGLTIDDVHLESKAGKILSAGRISVQYQLPMLLQRKVVINHLSLDGLRFNLIRNAEGAWNISEFLRPEKPTAERPRSGPPFQVLVKRFSITAGTVNIEDSSIQPIQVHLFEDLQLDIGLESTNVLMADVRSLAFRLNNPPLDLKDLKARIHYDTSENRLRVDDFSIETDHSQLSLNALLQQDRPEPEITLDIKIAALSLDELGQWLSITELNRGMVVGKVHLKGSLKRMYHRLSLELDGQYLTAEGLLTGESGHDLGLETRGTIRNLNPAGWPLDVTTDWPGDMNADFSLTGKKLDKPDRQAHLTVQLMASSLAGYRIDNGVFDLAAENGRLVLSEGHLTGPGGNLRLQGQVEGVNSPTQALNAMLSAKIRHLDTDALLPGPKMGGIVNADLKINAEGQFDASGHFDPNDWTGSADLRLFQSVVLATDIKEGKLQAGWDGKVLQLKTADVQSAMGHASFQGQATVQPLSYQIEGEILLAELKKIVPPLKQMVPQIPTDQLPNGRFQINGAVQGKENQIDIQAILNADSLTHDDLTVASARLDGDWQISGTDVTGRAEGYMTDITYEDTLFPRLDIRVNLSPTDVLADLKLAKDSGEQLQMAGQIAQWQKEDRRIRIDTLKVTGITDPLRRLMPEINNPEPILIETHPDSIDIDVFKLAAGPMLFRADGRLSREGSQGLQLSLTGLDLKQFAALWQEEPALRGLLTAEVNLGGTGEWPTIDAQVRVKDASGYEVSLSDLDFQLTYRDKTASLLSKGFRKGRKIFDIEGHSGLTLRLLPFEFTPEPGSLQALFVANDLNLSELPNPLQRDVAIDGLVTLQLKATGDLEQPQLTGFLTLKDGSLALPRHNLTYESVQADMNLRPGKLTIEKIELRGDREGTLNLTGDMLLTGFVPSSLNLHLTGNQAPIAWRRKITARIDPDISLTGKPSALVLTGRLRIPEGRINLDRMAAGGPADIQIVGEQSSDDQLIIISEPQEDDLLSSLSAEVTIEVPGNVWLRGQDLNAEIAGEIQLKKKPQGPFLLYGALNTVRGNYLFQSRRFEVTRGNIQFQGLKEPDPELDIRAEARIRDVEIIVRITGSAKMIELSLESEPMMDKADIVSYLVFGRPTNALRTEQATNAQVAALDMAGQLAARELNEILGNTLAVDEIRFDAGENNWGSLTLGKYVTRNIFVTYRTGNFDAKSYGQVGVEYEINRNFSIETQFGDDLTSGVDLIWKTDF